MSWKRRLILFVVVMLFASMLGSYAWAAEPGATLDVAPGVPRHETLILENPEAALLIRDALIAGRRVEVTPQDCSAGTGHSLVHRS